MREGRRYTDETDQAILTPQSRDTQPNQADIYPVIVYPILFAGLKMQLQNKSFSDRALRLVWVRQTVV